MRTIFLLLFGLIMLNMNYFCSYYSGIPGITTPLVVFCILALLFGLIKNRQVNIKDNIFKTYLFFLILITLYGWVVVLLYDGGPLGSKYKELIGFNIYDRIKNYLIYFIFYCFFFSDYMDRSMMKKMHFLLMLGSLTVPVFYFNSIEVFDKSYLNEATNTIERASGIYGNPNLAGFFGNITLCFTMYFLVPGQHHSFRYRLYLYVSVIISILAVVLTFSNTAILMLVVLLLMKLLSYVNFNNLFHMAGLFVAGLAMTLIVSSSVFELNILEYLPLSNAQQERLQNQLSVFEFNTKALSYTDRDMVWSKGMGYIYANPVIGYGLGSFENDIYYSQGIHNSYLEVWGEAGVFFLFFYLGIIIYILRAIWNCRSPDKTFLLMLFISILVFSTVTHGIYYGMEYLILLALIFAFLHRKEYQIQTL